MRPHPRIRRAIKWGGAGALLALVVAWAVSVWWLVMWSDGNGLSFAVARGAALAGTAPKDSFTPERGLTLIRTRELVGGSDLMWLPQVEWTRRERFVAAPLWLPTLLLLLATGAAWRLDVVVRRRARGLCCPGCGYELVGLPAGVGACPECGASRPGS